MGHSRWSHNLTRWTGASVAALACSPKVHGLNRVLNRAGGVVTWWNFTAVRLAYPYSYYDYNCSNRKSPTYVILLNIVAHAALELVELHHTTTAIAKCRLSSGLCDDQHSAHDVRPASSWAKLAAPFAQLRRTERAESRIYRDPVVITWNPELDSGEDRFEMRRRA